MFSIHASWASDQVEHHKCKDRDGAVERCLELYSLGYIIHRIRTPGGHTIQGADLHGALRAVTHPRASDASGTTRLGRALDHVADAEAIVAKQKLVLQRLAVTGGDTQAAGLQLSIYERLLEQMKDALALVERRSTGLPGD